MGRAGRGGPQVLPVQAPAPAPLVLAEGPGQLRLQVLSSLRVSG